MFLLKYINMKNIIVSSFICMFAFSITLNMMTFNLLDNLNNAYNITEMNNKYLLSKIDKLETKIEKTDVDISQLNTNQNIILNDLNNLNSIQISMNDEISKIKANNVKSKSSKSQSNIDPLNEKNYVLNASAYCLKGSKTYTGVHPKINHTVAVSHDLKSWIGKKVDIEGVGVRYVEDLMSSKYKKSIDIYGPDENWAKLFGRKDLKVTLLD